MARTFEISDEEVAGLGACVDALATTGFDPRDEESLVHAATQLRRLGNHRTFLGDILVDELAARHRDEDTRNSYGPQVIMLAPPSERSFFMRANIWPSEDEHMMRASGGNSFVYGLPHDHNFDFLTLGYFGPGYWSDYYEYDYESVAGWSGEPVDLRFVERAALSEGKIVHYRAHRDVHAQIPADSLSVSINILHASGAQGWLDQYSFDVEADTIKSVISPGGAEIFLRVAVGLGGAEAMDLAENFARSHPSDRMRLSALEAQAGVLDIAAQDDLWRRAEGAGSVLIAREAANKRAALELA